MSTVYNLRRSKRIRDQEIQNCYTRIFLENHLTKAINPKVYVQKLRVLESSSSYSFYLENGNIIPKEPLLSKKENSKKKIVGIIFFFILCVMFLNYLKDDLYLYSTNNISLIWEKNKDPKILPDRLKKKNGLPKSSASFIEEECKRENTFKMLVNYSKSQNSFYNTASFDFSNITDYALQSKGAKIVSIFDTQPYGVLSVKFWEYDLGSIQNYFITKYIKYTSKGPSSILVPWNKPGDCWAFKGSQGRVQIQLSETIIITAVSLDHITKDLSFYRNIKSAPKKFSIIGLRENMNQRSSKIYLGSFEYKISGSSVQIFTVKPIAKNFFQSIELVIESNHGNKEYTCIYKIGIYGHK